MNSFLLKTGLLTVCMISLFYGKATAESEPEWALKCANQYGAITSNENPTFQHINCLLTNAAIQADIPPEVVKGIATKESDWRQFVDGKPYISKDNGIGIMQITDKTLTEEQKERLKNDILYNIETGVRILNDKASLTSLPHINGAGRDIIENWYFPVMAYNGTVPVNSPLFQDTGEINHEAYQELVFGKIKKDSYLDGTDLARYPFDVKDFNYDRTSDDPIEFLKSEYIVEGVHATTIELKAGDRVLTTKDKVNLRKGPGASGIEKVLPINTSLIIEGPFEFDEDKTSKNQFVWFPVKTLDGQYVGSISSAYIEKQVNTVSSVISGVISEDRVLTKEGSPYIQTGPIVINSGVTLTIEPGVELIGKNGSPISVNGKLIAVGTEQERIKLQDVYVKGSNFNNSMIQIEYADHFYPSRYNGGFLVTTINKNVTLRYNQYRNGSISLSSSVLDSIIEHNFFSQKATLNVNNGLGKIIIKNNTFINPLDYYVPDIKLTSRDPDGGIANIFINENNFFGYPRLKVDISGYKGILFDGKNNYWGVTDTKQISQGIVDVNDNINYRDKLDVSTISYKPFDNSYPIGALEAPVVAKVSDRDQLVSGITDADSLVEIYNGDEKIGEGDSHHDGSFQIPIKLQKVGTELKIKVRDSFNRTSPITKVTVLDETPPEVPIVNEVTDSAVEITGKAEPFSTVEAMIASESLGTDVSDEYGNFSIAIGKLKADTQVLIFAKDASGNISEAKHVTVVDRTPPAVPQLLTNEITDQMAKISGVTDKGSIIKVVAGETVIGSAYAEDGTFSIEFQPQAAGTMIEVFAEDLFHNSSESVRLTVKDVTPPWLKLSFDFPVTDASNKVKGNSESGAKIIIMKGEELIAEDYAKEDGSFEIPISLQKAGTVLTVTASDTANNVSPSIRTTVIDKTPPSEPSVNSVNNKAVEITGKTEAKATVKAVIGSKTYSSSADANGQFKIIIPVQHSGTVISVTSTDLAQNQSQTIKVTVSRIVPDIPVVNTVTNKSTTVTGITEKATKVFVKAGTLSYSGIAGTDGKFIVRIPAQNNGVELSITSQDAAGNISLPMKKQVTRVAPDIPVVNTVTNKSTTVTGISEKAATVIVTAGKLSYSGNADSLGKFTIKIPTQNSGVELSITAKDKAGNISLAQNMRVTKVAPNVPAVNPINNKAATVTGKTEKYAVVTVKIGTNSYSANADSVGNFKVSIPIQNSGISINVTATVAGKVSNANSLKVTRVAPNIPVVSSVRYYSTTVTGKTEKYAVASVKIGTKVYTSQANIYGDFKVNIPKQKAGTYLDVTVKDAKELISATRTVKVY
ncbi:Ig-like domain-containing protein [Gottfriedia acidiceleris]|uniref:Ig-like domain-containing protein n=1 Tax=Gottfriedia acidiceleris TaxID=371036 RepID=A0ABY4JIJ1_9BACI|nr:Ig-like domain-containing protein [Gottfriedia acidiceleris]UPM53655.1 Ig-like domain-containing protein [Gottfriedia acidiceleris]